MQERDVITLDENLDYLLVKELEFEDNKYFLAMGIDEDNIYAEDHFFLTVGTDEKITVAFLDDSIAEGSVIR